MGDKVNILISVDPEFVEMLDDLKKLLYGRTKGAQSKTVQDALIALAREEKFERALKKLKEARQEIQELQKEVKADETK